VSHNSSISLSFPGIESYDMKKKEDTNNFLIPVNDKELVTSLPFSSSFVLVSRPIPLHSSPNSHSSFYAGMEMRIGIEWRNGNILVELE
jgi:hypothetical protein